MLNSGPIAKKLRGHFGSGANYSDDHVEVPVRHQAKVEMYQDRGDPETAVFYEVQNPRNWIRGKPVEVEQ